MSLASILDNNKDINFPELIVGNLQADTITARIINGGGGGGGSIPSLSEVCSASGSDPISVGSHTIGGLLELDFSQGTNNVAFGMDASGNLRYTKSGWADAYGTLYDSHYNQPTGGGGGNFSTPSTQLLDMGKNEISNVGSLTINALGNVTTPNIEFTTSGTNSNITMAYDPTTGFLRYTTGSWVENNVNNWGVLYDTNYNRPAGVNGAGAVHSNYLNLQSSITGAVINGATASQAISQMATVAFPTACTLFKMSINLLSLNANYTGVSVIGTATIALLLCNANGTIDGGQNTWGYTYTPTSDIDQIVYNSPVNTTIDLWYASPAPTKTICFGFQSKSSVAMSNALMNSIVMTALITGYESTTDTSITMTAL